MSDDDEDAGLDAAADAQAAGDASADADPGDSEVARDATAQDAMALDLDADGMDATQSEASVLDASSDGAPEASALDASLADASSLDAALPDASVLDADASPPDAALPDASLPDASLSDASAPDPCAQMLVDPCASYQAAECKAVMPVCYEGTWSCFEKPAYPDIPNFPAPPYETDGNTCSNGGTCQKGVCKPPATAPGCGGLSYLHCKMGETCNTTSFSEPACCALRGDSCDIYSCTNYPGCRSINAAYYCCRGNDLPM